MLFLRFQSSSVSIPIWTIQVQVQVHVVVALYYLDGIGTFVVVARRFFSWLRSRFRHAHTVMTSQPERRGLKVEIVDFFLTPDVVWSMTFATINRLVVYRYCTYST
jgi:hypothetical protein